MKKIFGLKLGFTLAEVLIAIVIVGVVAAITIPALHTKITKYVLKKQIRKAMSLVAQNYRLTIDEVGSVSDDLTNQFSYSTFNSAFLNNFKMARICKGKGLENKCVPEYEGLPTKSWGYFSENSIYNARSIYQTMDGIIFIPYTISWLSYWLVDVNGMKGPNKAGWDLFFVSMRYGEPVWSAKGPLNQSNEVKGGITSTDINLKTVDNW
jgi:prepilin-type N-terminal cleavage/methylation domain-containing protein